MVEKQLGIKVIPVYGMIAASGGTWTVEYHVTKNNLGFVSHSTTGYGEFPIERYPDIPVIDYTSAKPGMLAQALSISNDLRPQETEPSYHKGTLETFLNEIRKIGIEVLS